MPNQPSDLKSFLEAIDGHDFLVLDTETTGLGSDDEMCELAIITANGETMFNELIRPTKPISPDASRVTGITDRMVHDKFCWDVHRDKVLSIITGNIIVTYNATFDRKIMHQSDRALHQPEFNYSELSPWYCAMTAFAERYGNWNDYRGSFQWVKLIEAVQFYDVIPDGAFHGALSDAKMTLAVVGAMQREIELMKKVVIPEGGEDFWNLVPGHYRIDERS